MKYYQRVKWVMALFLAVFPEFIYSQQNVDIKGLVYDENSQIPIEFANISIKNTAAGTTNCHYRKPYQLS